MALVKIIAIGLMMLAALTAGWASLVYVAAAWPP
jgi:hypothetical protein